MRHELKILPEYFEAILSGDKSFEVRSTVDRTFNPSDELRLREWQYSKVVPERAVCDVLIDKLKSWNYVSTGKVPK